MKGQFEREWKWSELVIGREEAFRQHRQLTVCPWTKTTHMGQYCCIIHLQYIGLKMGLLNSTLNRMTKQLSVTLPPSYLRRLGMLSLAGNQ